MLRYLILFVGSCSFCYAQDETFNSIDYLEYLDIDISNLEFANLYIQDLEELAKHKIDINRADSRQLALLRFLNEHQIENIINYINTNGPLISKYELQAIEGLSRQDIALLLPFLKPIRSNRLITSNVGANWAHDFVITQERAIEKSRGYLPNDNGTIPFAGDPWQTIIRYFGRNSNGIKTGLLFQKDSGERWTNKRTKIGFDYLSYHLELKNISNSLKQLNLGDYHLNLGQGLIHSTLFTAAQSVDLNQIVKPDIPLRAYHSISESNFLRGASAILAISEHLSVIPFISNKNRDANIVVDVSWGSDSIRFSSLQESGLHRTQSELEDQNSINHLIYGGSIQHERNSLKLGLNWLRHQFNHTFWPRELPYNKFAFRGSFLTNTSIDYRWNKRKFYSFGEFALSEYQHAAIINGLIFTPSSNLDIGILGRHISKSYRAIGASAFTENTSPNNERGLYLTAAVRPQNKDWTLFGAVDFYYHPWQKFRLSAASDGFESIVRFDKRVKRKYQYYIQIGLKSEDAEFNTQERFKTIDKKKLTYARIHCKLHASQNIELQSRIEIRQSNDPLKHSTGLLAFQQITFRTQEPKWNVHARFTYFDIDDFDSRIYTFEPNLRYNFSVPFYFNQGFRVFVNARFKWPQSSIGLRYGWTKYIDDSEGFGSGHDFIQGKNRQQIKMQFIYHL